MGEGRNRAVGDEGRAVERGEGKELVIQRARNRPIDVKAALTNAERKLAV